MATFEGKNNSFYTLEQTASGLHFKEKESCYVIQLATRKYKKNFISEADKKGGLELVKNNTNTSFHGQKCNIFGSDGHCTVWKKENERDYASQAQLNVRYNRHPCPKRWSTQSTFQGEMPLLRLLRGYLNRTDCSLPASKLPTQLWGKVRSEANSGQERSKSYEINALNALLSEAKAPKRTNLRPVEGTAKIWLDKGIEERTVWNADSSNETETKEPRAERTEENEEARSIVRHHPESEDGRKSPTKVHEEAQISKFNCTADLCQGHF
ncbi:hypothetical protein WN51_03713 [Melipona quadrifasciata]|uniref:Uncharacterized protein n=1 Tax=Melipona quadrifasciata TaxID=166423 RepID=A0A0M8ZT84_9HYME|nr:hypothetical protein WN51_03713 [Melipona quadrifasciata]